MTLRFTSMSAALVAGISAVVVLTCAIGAYLYSLRHFETLLDTARHDGKARSELIRAALEHQMMENDRSLIARMVQDFGAEPGVGRVVLLDRLGAVRYSSAPDAPGEFSSGSETCRVCHRLPPDQRTGSRVIDAPGGTILRIVTPVPNRERCHGCHDAGHRINGVLMVDIDAAGIRAAMNRDLWWLAGGSGTLALFLGGGVALVVRLVVMRRLRRFETTARMIANGDLQRRVPAGGSDVLSWLGREFNAMADSMTGLLGDVSRERERLETVINSIDDGIVVLDAERRVVAANAGFLRRTGRARDAVLGSSCRHATHGMCGIDCPTLACLNTGERQVRICERRSPAGLPISEEVHASPIRDGRGAVTQVVEVWRDISERRAAEARLAESHRMASLGMLASGFSHEINTPLATVLTCVEGILRSARPARPEEPPDWPRVAESAATAREQLLRCRGITQHFLRLSRGHAPQPDIVELGPTLAAVGRLIQPTAREHGVQLELPAVVPECRVRASEPDLQHALLNLLLNGIQACARSGSVRVAVDGADPVRIRISDEGCGIELERQARIFEPFVSFRDGGTGLGLFLSMNFVRRWGGDICVDSAPGRGSTFEITLPAAGPDRTPARP